MSYIINKKENPIVICGNFTDAGGYSYVSRAYTKRLVEQGWPVKIECMMSNVLDISQEDKLYFDSLREYDTYGNPIPVMDPSVIKIVCFVPLINIPKYKHNVIYTMTESQKVEPTFVRQCNRFYDSCWTPTQYYADVFKECGMTIPVRVLPIGVDEIYNESNKVKDFKFNYTVFGNSQSDQPTGHKFLSVFRWSFRKGFDVLIRSFLEEFKESDNVSLVIVSRHVYTLKDYSLAEEMEKDIQSLFAKYGRRDSASIYWCRDVIPFELMPSMYGVGDTFILPSRGEGQCLPALEASAMGLPCILPKHTGFTDYVNDDTCYPIDVDEWVVSNSVPEWHRWIINNYFKQKFPKFGDKTIEQVRSLMRRAMDNRDEAKLKNIKMKEIVDSKYKWSACIEKVEEYIGDIA